MYADWRALQELRKHFKVIDPKTYGMAMVDRKNKLRGGWKRR